MIVVSANENLKVLYKRKNEKIDFKGYFLCASLSGIISSFITTPLDNIKTRLNVQRLANYKFKTLLQQPEKILKNFKNQKHIYS